MAWLHAWTGLVAGWLLLVACVTGSAAYYRDELSLWMRPELHVASLAPVAQADAARRALAALQTLAPGADSWMIDLPQARTPLTGISWSSARGAIMTPGAGRPGGTFESATLDSVTGAAPPPARDTRGGDFFYVFHFTLHYLPVLWGRWLVSICTMVMLVAIISGVVTHRRFFADFFTFRPGKGQRSWLDAHNALGVLALPFHLMICYSGLVALMFLSMPWAVKALYPEGRGAFFAEALPQALRLPPAAMAVYFWLNRLLPAALAQRAGMEVNGFFIAWGVCAGAALLWPAKAMWRWQLALGGTLFAALPLLNLATKPAGARVALLQGATGLVAAVDAGLLLVGVLLAILCWRLRPALRSTPPGPRHRRHGRSGIAPSLAHRRSWAWRNGAGPGAR